MSQTLSDRLERAAGILRQCESVVIGFSGGVDSALVARLARDALGAGRVLAVTGLSAAVPEVQRRAARAFAADQGIAHLEIATSELERPGYVRNDGDRCYHCKSELWPVLCSNLRGRALYGTSLRGLKAALSFVIPPLRRTPLLAAELDRSLFHGAELPQLPDWIAINATNLATGKGWRFFSDSSGDYLAGATSSDGVSVAEAVAASAAYPGLTDPYPFKTRWEALSEELLDERWAKPEETGGETWRSRYGRAAGKVTMPLVDGGVYDNEGVNALRGNRISCAIISGAAPAGSAEFSRGWRHVLRLVGVMHSRLGAITRQHAHEMTHAVDPGTVRDRLLELADEIKTEHQGDPKLMQIAGELSELAGVGWPPRGHQFSATVPILLHRDDVARNVSGTYEEDAYDIPECDRGLRPDILAELSRVRTDLDALEETVLDLLIAQGYFLADAHLKIAVPKLVAECTGRSDPRKECLPAWEVAHASIRSAHANPERTIALLRKAAKRSVFGRRGSRSSSAAVRQDEEVM